MIKNIFKIFRSPIGVFWIILGIALIALPGYYFTDKILIIGNLGYNFYLTEISLTIAIAILFGLFLGATLYKISSFQVKKTWAWMFGWLLWVLVTGCPSCTITLASYLWLAGFMWIFPFGGIELKVLSVIILLYVNYTTIRDLNICKIKK